MGCTGSKKKSDEYTIKITPTKTRQLELEKEAAEKQNGTTKDPEAPDVKPVPESTDADAQKRVASSESIRSVPEGVTSISLGYNKRQSKSTNAAPGSDVKGPDEKQPIESEVAATDDNPTPWANSEAALRDFLAKSGTDVSKFGTGNAKTLETLFVEIRDGESTLNVDEEGKVTRVVEPIFIHLRYGTQLLVLTAQIFEDGRKRTSLQRVIAGKKGPGDGGTYNAALRGMSNALGIPAEKLEEPGILQYREDLYGFELENFESPSYPGLQSLYRTHYVQFNILEGGLDVFQGHGLPGGTEFETDEASALGTKKNFWQWMQVVDARRAKVKKFSPGVPDGEDGAGPDLSALKTDQDLKLLLEQDGVDTAKFGVGKAKSIGALLKEVKEGSSRLEYDSRTGRIQRTVEPAFVMLCFNDWVLVEKMQILEDGRERQRNMLLAEKMEPEDPSTEYAALRGIHEELTIPLEELQKEGKMKYREDRYCMMLETMDSKSYPGLTCVYKTHYIQVDILNEGLEFFKDKGLPFGDDFWTEETSSKGTKKMHWGWVDVVQAQEDKVKGMLQPPQGAPRKYSVVDKNKLEWMDIGRFETIEALRDLLKECNVSVEKWAEVQLAALLQEMTVSVCTLERRDKHLRRVVRPAFISVKQQGGQLVTAAPTSKGGEKEPTDSGAMEQEPTGGDRDAFDTDASLGALGNDDNSATAVHYNDILRCFEAEIDDSMSFPGLNTIQRTKRVQLDTQQSK